MPPDPFPQAVRRLARERGYSLAEVARRGGLQRTHLHQLLAGTRSPGLLTLRRLSEALGVPLAELELTTRERE